MASSLFANKNPIPQNNMGNMLQQFASFKQQMQGKDPKAIVQNMLANGQMSKEQYTQLCNMAKSLQSILK